MRGRQRGTVAALLVAACLALELYCYRIRKYVGAYCAVLGRVDALVFTGGIGENAARVRSLACAGIESLGIALDEHANDAAAGELAEIGSKACRCAHSWCARTKSSRSPGRRLRYSARPVETPARSPTDAGRPRCIPRGFVATNP